MTKPYATLTGDRAHPADGRSCGACGRDAQPHLVFNTGGRARIPHAVCLPCVGRAVEQATNWKVMNAWSQWLAQQQSGQQIRALRVAQKEARDAGLPEPTHKELPQWSKMK